MSAHSTAAATKHKDNRSLKRYAHPNEALLAEAALGQVAAMHRDTGNYIAGVECSSSVESQDDESSSPHNKRTKSSSSSTTGKGQAFHFHLA